MITTKSQLTGPSGVLKDSNLISGNKVLENSFEEMLSTEIIFLPGWGEQTSRPRSGLSWCHCKELQWDRQTLCEITAYTNEKFNLVMIHLKLSLLHLIHFKQTWLQLTPERKSNHSNGIYIRIFVLITVFNTKIKAPNNRIDDHMLLAPSGKHSDS